MWPGIDTDVNKENWPSNSIWDIYSRGNYRYSEMDLQKMFIMLFVHYVDKNMQVK